MYIIHGMRRIHSGGGYPKKTGGAKDTLINDFNIFLSGKITGLNPLDANHWRREFADKIENDWFGNTKTPHVINPCEYSDSMDLGGVLREPKELVRWELRQARQCDLLVAAVSKNQDSIGTACEVATAYAAGKPILLYNEHRIPHKNIHPFIWEMSDTCLDDLQELCDYITEVYLI